MTISRPAIITLKYYKVVRTTFFLLMVNKKNYDLLFQNAYPIKIINGRFYIIIRDHCAKTRVGTRSSYSALRIRRSCFVHSSVSLTSYAEHIHENPASLSS